MVLELHRGLRDKTSAISLSISFMCWMVELCLYVLTTMQFSHQICFLITWNYKQRLLVGADDEVGASFEPITALLQTQLLLFFTYR